MLAQLHVPTPPFLFDLICQKHEKQGWQKQPHHVTVCQHLQVVCPYTPSAPPHAPLSPSLGDDMWDTLLSGGASSSSSSAADARRAQQGAALLLQLLAQTTKLPPPQLSASASSLLQRYYCVVRASLLPVSQVGVVHFMLNLAIACSSHAAGAS